MLTVAVDKIYKVLGSCVLARVWEFATLKSVQSKLDIKIFLAVAMA